MRKLAFEIEGRQAGVRLDEALGERLPEALGTSLSKSSVRQLIMAGAVRVNGRPSRRPGLPLAAGDRIDAQVALAKLAEQDADVPFTLTPKDVLYEDEWLLAVDKPPGISTVATADPKRPFVVEAVQRYLGLPKKGEPPYVGVHHRLDRGTSGVVLFTKDPAANAGLAQAFAAREVEKTYHALASRPATLPPTVWRVSGNIELESGESVSMETEFERLRVFPRALLVEARPRTGRKHQIRIHLAAKGMPILGDERYRGTATPVAAPRMMLHARSLRLVHPVTGKELRIEARQPDDFRRMLRALVEDTPPRRR
jgi:RluA family pseudouridine synthase